MPKNSYVYILTNQSNKVLYVGVTSNLPQRIWQHKQKSVPGFTNKYNVNKLDYYETIETIEQAITREKYFKKGTRQKKLNAINTLNPSWQDLSADIF